MSSIDWDQVQQHLEHLGRDHTEAPIVFAAYAPKSCQHFSKNGKPISGDVEAFLQQHPDHSLGFVVNPPGPQPADFCGTTWGTKADHIAGGVALFSEDDSGLPIEEQMDSWQLALMPEPSLQVFTGGKSIHHYWVLAGPITREQFKLLQLRLARVFAAAIPEGKSDKSLADACQVMRIAGSVHPKTGQKAEIRSASGERFLVEELEAALTAAEAELGLPSLEQLEAVPPPRISKEDGPRAINMLRHCDPMEFTAHDDWLGMGMALHNIDKGLRDHWIDWSERMGPDVFDRAECLYRWSTFDNGYQGRKKGMGSLHEWAKAGGYVEPKKQDASPTPGTESMGQGHGGADQPPLTEWEKRLLEVNAAGGGDPVAINDAKMALLEERALEVINSSRPIRNQKSAIKSLAVALGLRVNDNFVTELHESLDNSVAAYEPDVEPGGVFTAQSQSWLLHEIFLIGLNLLVGMPGASKSRLLVALIRAFLANQSTFISRALQPGANRHVLLIGTDQDRQQWGALLAEAGLAKVLSRTKNDDGTETVEYQLHNNITLLTSGGGFRLDADGMRRIRDWCRAHPGGLLIIDSLSAVLPIGVKEGDETAGRLMRQIEMARQGNCAIVTHHSSKSSAKEAELGVYSGSGSGSIDRAVSRFIGLGFETHVQNGKEKLHEDSPRRILTSQKRGATNQRLVLENGDFNTWDYIGTAAEMRELRRDDEEGCSAEERLRGWKKAVYAATTSDWLTTTEVFERLDHQRAKSANAKQQVRDNLRKLVTDDALLDQEVAEVRDGDTKPEAIWRRKPGLFA